MSDYDIINIDDKKQSYRITAYDVITNQTLYDYICDTTGQEKKGLRYNINEKIKEGWIPFGNLIFADNSYNQPMIKY